MVTARRLRSTRLAVGLIALLGLVLVAGCNFQTVTKAGSGSRSGSTATKRPAPKPTPKPTPTPTPTPTPDPAAVRAQAAQDVSKSLRVMNYYPASHSWEQMWLGWDATEFDRDMAKIAGLGANAVRLIVFPSVFGYPAPNEAMTARLASAISLASAHGLRVQLSLYDHWGGYTDLGGSRAWTTALLTPYASDPRIALIEVRNEVDPADTAAMTWVRGQITLIHTLVPKTPVTVSTAGSLGVGGLTSLKAALAPVAPDLFDFHYYGQAQLAYSTFQAALAAAAPAPLFIGETGFSSYTAGTDATSISIADAIQADWYRVVEYAAKASGLAGGAPWTLYDFGGNGVSSSASPQQYHYGLYRVDGTAKPAAAVVAAAFGGTLTAGPTNGDFRTLVAGIFPDAWTMWMPTGVLSVAAGAGVDGDNALSFAQTQQQAGGVTSWYTVPTQVVRAGQTWRVSVQARGVAATGLNDLTLGWYDAANNWLGNASSDALPTGTTGWQTLSVTATPPARAVAVRIYLRSSGNSGTVYYSRAGWTVS